MGETAGTDKVRKKSFIKGLQAEFGKIIWPDQATVTKETVTVLITATVLGAVIAALDFVIKWGLAATSLLK